jgi:hypothetical protein
MCLLWLSCCCEEECGRKTGARGQVSHDSIPLDNSYFIAQYCLDKRTSALDFALAELLSDPVPSSRMWEIFWRRSLSFHSRHLSSWLLWVYILEFLQDPWSLFHSLSSQRLTVLRPSQERWSPSNKGNSKGTGLNWCIQTYVLYPVGSLGLGIKVEVPGLVVGGWMLGTSWSTCTTIF